VIILKKNIWRIAITLILAYLVLMAAIFFAYVNIANNYILKQAETELVTTGEDIATVFSLQLDYDFNRFETLINHTSDPITDIDLASFEILDQQLLGISKVESRQAVVEGKTVTLYDVKIDEQTYTYTDDIVKDFDKEFAIYDFNDAFNITSYPDKYIVFRVDDYIGYFNAKAYIDHFFEANDMIYSHYLISADNRIYYSSITDESHEYFNDYFRDANYNQTYINDFSNEIYYHNSGILETKAFTGDDYLVYVDIDVNQTIGSTIYFAMVYESSSIRLSIGYLTGVLWALFLVVIVLYSLSTVMIYKIISKRIEDIQGSRLKLYYSKPYIVKIKKNGTIVSYNRAFKQFLEHKDIYDNVTDFRFKNKYIQDHINEQLDRQKAFTTLFQTEEGLRYIRFITTRTSGGYLLIGDDVSETEGKFDTFKTLALINSVTNLPNKNSLMDTLDELFSDQERLKRHNVLVAFDINNFSKINMLLGKKSGDNFLRLISELVLESIQGYEATVFNIEADKFVILFENLEDIHWVKIWIDKINETFEKPVTIARNLLNVNIKIGVFYIDTNKYELLNSQISYDNLMLSLEHAKGQSLKTYFEYDVALSIVASRENRMELDLAKAIKNNEFMMKFQPQYHNGLGRIVGFEALIRWTNPRYMNESPLKFIELAEKNSMIIDIGRIALHETFMAAKALEAYNVEISINVSPVQMLQAGFVNEIITTFEQYELKKGSISIEITETFLIDSFELIISKLQLLRKYGFNIHLDDFGTGYSSLQYLKELPITAIKIDKAFIDEVHTDTHAKAIVQMISQLAKNIDLDVIAEGVETLKQNQIVYKSGCDIIQGYVLSPAVTQDEAIELIKAYNIDKTKTIEVQKSKRERRK